MSFPAYLAGLLQLLIAAQAVPAQSDLSLLTDQLIQLRSTQGGYRDAGPELAEVKRALRVWIEQQLPSPPVSIEAERAVRALGAANLTWLGTRLTEALDAAGLTCGPVDDWRCTSDPQSEQTFRGFLDDIRIASLDDGRYLLVVTGVGIQCGFDESAYVYEEGPDHRWRLLFASEQDRYGEKEYRPQNFLSIDVSPSMVSWNEKAPLPLIATLGLAPYCQSNWNSLHAMLWRASSLTAAPRPLIDRFDALYLGNHSIANSRLTSVDWLVEFQGGSVDIGRLIRTHVAHYQINPGDRIEQIAPVALGPDAFVEEWLAADWKDASRWIEPRANVAALSRLHADMSRRQRSGGFLDSPRRCRTDATLWQSVYEEESTAGDTVPLTIHFKVRWMAPYRFTLFETSAKPFPGCDEEVPMPDDIGTLFPQEGWRR